VCNTVLTPAPPPLLAGRHRTRQRQRHAQVWLRRRGAATRRIPCCCGTCASLCARMRASGRVCARSPGGFTHAALRAQGRPKFTGVMIGMGAKVRCDVVCACQYTCGVRDGRVCVVLCVIASHASVHAGQIRWRGSAGQAWHTLAQVSDRAWRRHQLVRA
jgi:hypothetical protein